MGGSATLDPNVLVDSLVVDVIDGLRGDLHPQFGVRPYRVFTVRRTWTGQTPGEGEPIDTVVELTPQPRIESWDGYKWVASPIGIEEDGKVRATEVSLSYTYAELVGDGLAENEQWFIRLSEAYGQGQPDRFFALDGPPFPDREKAMGWILRLRHISTPGCG